MKERVRCADCGLVKNNSIHTYDHDYVKPPKEQKRTYLNPRSEAMKEFYSEERIPLVLEVLERDNGRCQIRAPGCHRYADTVHEILTRGRAGGIRALGVNTAENCVAACAHCNRWVGEHPREAEAMGMLESMKGRVDRRSA